MAVDPGLLENYFDRLWPIHRSITGAGVRQTLDILSELIPLEKIEVPSGTSCFDWTVPKEWVVRDAYVVDPAGHRVLDIAENNLHLVSYSTPFRGTLSREELDAHLFSRPDMPDAVPYVTSYYREGWGFCIEHARREALAEGQYEVVVDTDLIDGHLTIGEAVLEGETDREVLISCDTCHPSLASNELSGPLVCAFLYRELAAKSSRRLTYRFVFLPETIGSVVYLSMRGERLRERLDAGYVVTCVGDDGPFTYKRSRRGDCIADRAVERVLVHDLAMDDLQDLPFFPDDGSDERQYCSPGFNLPVGSLMRTRYGKFPQYHTSLDNRDFISFEAMARTVEVYALVLDALEANVVWMRTNPHAEPQLGKHGLYHTVHTHDRRGQASATLWFLNLADGEHDLLSIAQKSGHPVPVLADIASRCEAAGLVERTGTGASVRGILETTQGAAAKGP